MRLLTNFIKGRAIAPVGDEYLDDLNPATGEVIAKVPRSKGADVDFAVMAARKAFESWSQTSVAERADLLDAVASRIEKRSEELAELESRDTGKPIQVARTVDVPRAVANFRFFAGAVRHDQTSCHAMEGALNYTLRAPLGVVIKIAHGWNPRATWYLARAVLGVLGFTLRNPYPLHRQKAFLVPGVVPPEYLARLEAIPTWDEWDPDRDRWDYGWEGYEGAFGGGESRP